MQDSPKTPSGRRNIPIHASLWVALMAVKRENGQRVGEKLGIGRIGFHVFRHTLSTLAQAAGMPIGDVRGVLGHASAATTMLYTHPTEQARKVLDTLDLNGKVN